MGTQKFLLGLGVGVADLKAIYNLSLLLIQLKTQLY